MLPWNRERDWLLGEVEAVMKASADEVVELVRELCEENCVAKIDMAQLRQRLASGGAEASEVRDVTGTLYLARRVSDVAAKDLWGIVEACQRTMESGVVAVAAMIRRGGIRPWTEYGWQLSSLAARGAVARTWPRRVDLTLPASMTRWRRSRRPWGRGLSSTPRIEEAASFH